MTETLNETPVKIATCEDDSFADAEYFEERFPEGGVSKRGYRVDGELHGLVEELYPNGLTRSRYHYNHGVPDGDFEEFAPTGALIKKGSFWNGKLDGLCTEYFPATGQVFRQIEYTDGLEDGEFREFSITGLPVFTAHFKAGRLDGVYEKYCANGQVNWAGVYKGGRLISWTRDRVYLLHQQQQRQRV